MPAYAYQGITPVVDPSSYVHPLASLIGDVIVGPGCFIAPGASLRGDFGRIVVEGDSSIQDNVTVHANQLRDTVIKRGATIAHGSIIHGCEIGENALIGMNAVILDNAIIGDENLVAALALVKSDTITPPRSLVAGNPAKVVKSFEPHQVTWRNNGEGEYQKLARAALTDLVEAQPLRQASPERLSQRSQSEAVAVRLSGATAQLREERAAQTEIAKE
ncbi:phenylacetic acid degradation protein PaaY [Sphingomonadales bacterium 56]|uniref:gamma carbonic anhydrase family protein n=1 Tax=unclassified Sphingobium TaxID=2611147 RepID=UPI00191B2D2A|nr:MULTISPECIES: phenylacetic acid degradation protein PaaY [unclassified Sphingobium]MBY2930795.1 phenylacetic acid degradation protein PaaY [Sphingomonadales bacterium 56]MBY2960876.1 phenylacetic acid degradation protein PaaY [Sphingomonadales bacterium 58]CAD7342030.1 Carnitine operon protein CaiE [Sphingobium sp. S6]CAD7342079.1 Carnitine operon protein CaiE [Sphingobium sp. S8]